MTPEAASRTPGTDAVIHVLAIVILGLLLMLSPMALGALGWNYDGIGGSPPMRFHPATYLTLVLFVLVALRDGNPLASVIGAVLSDMRVALFLLVWSVLLWHGAGNQELPAAALVDTFLLPVLLLLIFRRLDEDTRASMQVLLHGAVIANALLGIGEVASGMRLTPFVAGGIPITDDWRATALFGHPLSNALMTGIYASTLLLGGARELTGLKRLLVLALMFVAMVAFGGRASFVLLLVLAGAAVLDTLVGFLMGRKFRLSHLAALLIVAPIVLVVLGAGLELGLFDQFLLRFTSDAGSANARVVMFELFRHFTLPELLLGPPQQQLNYLVHVLGIEYGIESLWIAFSLFYGIIPSILFFSGLLLFLISLLSHCRKRAWVIIAYFFLVNSTFLGIAGKSILFSVLCMALLLLLPAQRKVGMPAPSASVAGEARWRGAASC